MSNLPPPPAAAGGYGAPAAQPENNMKLAIGALVAGVLCGGCLGIIPAIVSLVQANKVKGLYQAGDVHGAGEAADKAKTWAFIGFGVSAVMFVVVIVVQIALAGSSDT